MTEPSRPDGLETQESFEVVPSQETPTSVSDFQDPEFEFDEGGLDLEAKEAELEAELEELSRNSSEGPAPFRGGSITPDGLIDEDFEEEIGQPVDEEATSDQGEFGDIARHGIIEMAGDDVFGRKVIVFSACKLPPKTELDHARLLEYMRHTLDQYVENDYIIVYFHHGMTSKNKPKLSWMVQVYRELDRKYKKNLKALYLVHPTNFIRILWSIFRPFISVKFGRKMMYINYLHELKEHLHFDQLKVPPMVLSYDAKLVAAHKPKYPYSDTRSVNNSALPKTQQFGVTLYYIKENTGHTIPPVVQETVEYLRLHALDTEGIFRRTANAAVLRQTQHKFNLGEKVDFEALGDITIPSVILKTFLRELQEPILTFELYEPIMKLYGQEKDRQIIEARRMLTEELPHDNYQVLKFILDLLEEVAAHSDKNRMTTQNLAIVFGPNLIWPKGQATLSTMGYCNSFTLLLLDHYDELFTR